MKKTEAIVFHFHSIHRIEIRTNVALIGEIKNVLVVTLGSVAVKIPNMPELAEFRTYIAIQLIVTNDSDRAIV